MSRAYNALKLEGQKFGKLTVVKQDGKDSSGHTMWLCQCDCGNKVTVVGSHLKNGNTKSCGCLSNEIREKANEERHQNKYYGDDEKRLRNIRDGMIKRCYKENSDSYKYYGGRGIIICDEWLHSFKTFYDWAIANGYQNNLTIDRINVNGNYEPSNCRWVTMLEQSKNKRNSKNRIS